MSTKKMRTAALTALAVPALIGSVMAAPAQAEVQSGTNLTYTSPQNVYKITGLPKGSYNLLVAKKKMNYSDSETSQVITKSSLRDQINEVYKMMKQEIFVMVPFGVIMCIFVIYIMINEI